MARCYDAQRPSSGTGAKTLTPDMHDQRPISSGSAGCLQRMVRPPAYVRKTDRPPRGSQLAAIREAGKRGPFTCLDVSGPWTRRQIQVALAMFKRRGRVHLVKPAVWGRYGTPAIYATQRPNDQAHA